MRITGLLYFKAIDFEEFRNIFFKFVSGHQFKIHQLPPIVSKEHLPMSIVAQIDTHFYTIL